MLIGIPKEISEGENRVALIPSVVNILKKSDYEICIEKGAGEKAGYMDDPYKDAGAKIEDGAEAIYNKADIILKVRPPEIHPALKKHEAGLIRENGIWIGFLSPIENIDILKIFRDKNISSFAMEFIPRISRAQSMDALSSMATLAGYKAVLIGANLLGKIFPLMMTAAGTITPATVLVLGAGVAGLQAIATAKRLGAKVEAFDPRPAVRDQVKSVGAAFIEMELPEEDLETSGGYAKEQSDAFLLKEQEAIAGRLPKVDLIITTAQVFGKKAPVLITEEMVKLMKPGSVIVDLAAEQGGNCALTRAGQNTAINGINIYGAVNLPSTMAANASQLYSKNISNFFRHILAQKTLDLSDEITSSACVTHQGKITKDFIAESIDKRGK